MSLAASGTSPSTRAVRAALANDDVWSQKLRRPNFTARKVEEALVTLSRLRLLSQGGHKEREGMSKATRDRSGKRFGLHAGNHHGCEGDVARRNPSRPFAGIWAGRPRCSSLHGAGG